MIARSLAGALCALALVALTTGCTASTPNKTPTLADLEAEKDLDKAGAWLMQRTDGLTRLDAPARESGVAWVAVHGYDSAGKEWVRSLVELGRDGTQVYFYRWDWKTCHTGGSDGLVAALDKLAATEGVDQIRLIGHSFGGLISALAVRRYAGADPLSTHVVAAPLAGTKRLESACGTVEPGPAPTGPVTVKQWRTVKQNDGAFKDLDTDPQVVDWAGDDVVQLPAEWNGRRLGHNWSIAYVVERIRAEGEAAPQPAAPVPTGEAPVDEAAPSVPAPAGGAAAPAEGTQASAKAAEVTPPAAAPPAPPAVDQK